jgi:hypothetical protein
LDNTLNGLIAQLGELRAAKKQLEFGVKDMEGRITIKERQIMDVLDDQRLTESGGPAGKVILSESVYPQVASWDEFHAWILENHYMHFLEKRPAVLAYREAINQGIPVPGVLPFTKRKLTFKEV